MNLLMVSYRNRMQLDLLTLLFLWSKNNKVEVEIAGFGSFFEKIP